MGDNKILSSDKESRDHVYDPPEVLQYWEENHPVMVSAKLHLSYQNQSGDVSSRNIHIKKYDGSCYLKGHCDLRKEHRTFRIDRVLDCYDIGTGEVVTHIPDHLFRKKYSYDYKVRYIFTDFKEMIKVLLFVAIRSDDFIKSEFQLIYKSIVPLSKYDEVDLQEFNEKLATHIVPSERSYKIAFGKLIKQKRERLVAAYKTTLEYVTLENEPHRVWAINYMKKRMTEEKVKPEFWR